MKKEKNRVCPLCGTRFRSPSGLMDCGRCEMMKHFARSKRERYRELVAQAHAAHVSLAEIYRRWEEAGGIALFNYYCTHFYKPGRRFGV